jgi:hypothetical protein
MLYAEMFAYSMAAAQLNLKHTLLRNLMTGCMVAWPKSDIALLSRSVDAFIVQEARDARNVGIGQEVNNRSNNTRRSGHGGASSCFLHPLKPPAFLHYCTHYKSAIDDHVFGKRAVPHGILDCESSSLLNRDSKTKSPKAGHGKDAIWGALAYCAIVRGIDHARDEHCMTSESRK